MGVAHALYRAGASPVHRLPPQVKIVAALATVIAVVATPREAFAAFAVFAALLAGVAAVAQVPPGWLGRRVLIEVPFVLLAVLLPFVEGGERVGWLGLSLSVDGLYGGWNILAKGTLGVVTSLLLAATTSSRDLLLGLERLRLPPLLVQIATFMLRYLDVIAGNARAMRIARMSRCHNPRFLWQAKAFAMSIGALFLRSFERGERVYVAMLSRGYTGSLPRLDDTRPRRGQWAAALALPGAATTVTVSAWLLT
ncbi:MAG TPA: cobalt ECF transporter T component CbiQ [Cryptosporangiaceae bacterium]|nr:cobalt ECF transporter T component CbiQ [Cryptosporangiaceae bacterium]